MIAAIHDAIQLDIFELNFKGSTFAPEIIPDVVKYSGLFPQTAMMGGYFIRGLKWMLSQPVPRPYRPVVFFAWSLNQRASLQSLSAKVGAGLLVSPYNKKDGQFPLALAVMLSLPFLPLLLIRYLEAKPTQRKSFRFMAAKYWLTYGYYLAARWWLRKMHASGLVISNDHILFTSALIEAAKNENIVTFYLPHATVLESWPALSVDIALLDGLDSLNKYDKEGSSRTICFLVGIPKFDQFFSTINQNICVADIGICTNRNDSIELTTDLCKAIYKNIPKLRMTLRPHPRDDRLNMWRSIATQFSMRFSDPKAEPAFEFLGKVDSAIASESAILLEAVLMNVVPLYYNLVGTVPDYYGYLRAGLVEYFDSSEVIVEKLAALMKFKPSVRQRGVQYCASINSAYDGNSTEVAALIIERRLAQKTIHTQEWQIVPNLKHVTAYQLTARVQKESLSNAG